MFNLPSPLLFLSSFPSILLLHSCFCCLVLKSNKHFFIYTIRIPHSHPSSLSSHSLFNNYNYPLAGFGDQPLSLSFFLSLPIRYRRLSHSLFSVITLPLHTSSPLYAPSLPFFSLRSTIFLPFSIAHNTHLLYPTPLYLCLSLSQVTLLPRTQDSILTFLCLLSNSVHFRATNNNSPPHSFFRYIHNNPH